MLIDEFDDDFRSDAIEASIIQLRLSGATNPLDARSSLCLPTENGRAKLKSQMWMIVISIAVAIFAFAAAGILIFLQSRQPDEDQSVLAILIAVGLVIIAISSLMLPTLCQGLLVRRHLGERFTALKNSLELSAVFSVGIEDPATFSSLKVISDDIAYVGIDSTNRRLIIEGVLCRYLIRAEDIQRLESRFEQSSPGTEIDFRINESVTLAITIEKMNLRAETMRQLGGGAKNVAYEEIRKGLQLEL